MRGRAALGGMYRGCHDEKTCSNLSLTLDPPALSRVDYCCRCKRVRRRCSRFTHCSSRSFIPASGVAPGILTWPWPALVALPHQARLFLLRFSLCLLPQGDSTQSPHPSNMEGTAGPSWPSWRLQAIKVQLEGETKKPSRSGLDKPAQMRASQMSQSPCCDESRTSPRQLRKLAQTTAAAAAEVLP